MDINLLTVIITCFVLIFFLMSVLFSVENESRVKIKFFSNEKYHRHIYFVTLGIVLFLLLIMIMGLKDEKYLSHVIVISTLLIFLRRRIVKQ